MEQISTLSSIPEFEDSKPPSSLETMVRYVGRIGENVERLFRCGEMDDNNIKSFSDLSVNGELDKQAMLKLFLDEAYKVLPKPVKDSLKEDPFSYAPIQRDSEIDYVVGGYTNSVYKMVPQKSKLPELAILIHRPRFGTVKEAFARAQKLRDEHVFYRDLYKNIDNFVPDEEYLIYADYKNRPNVMCVKTYENNPMKDPRRDYSQEELTQLLKSNSSLANQFEEFLKISFNKIDVLKKRGLDLSGRNNLTIIGTSGNERLVLMDPHDDSVQHRASKNLPEILTYLKKCLEDSYS